MMISAGKIKSMVSLMREEETSVLFHFNLQTDEEPNNIPGSRVVNDSGTSDSDSNSDSTRVDSDSDSDSRVFQNP